MAPVRVNRRACCWPSALAQRSPGWLLRRSQADLAGRVFKAEPAPANLVIPAYHFASENNLALGVDT